MRYELSDYEWIAIKPISLRFVNGSTTRDKRGATSGRMRTTNPIDAGLSAACSGSCGSIAANLPVSGQSSARNERLQTGIWSFGSNSIRTENA